MTKTLLIVESPAKAKKIQKMLSSKYIVSSSFGHLRNLKGKNKGVDVNNNFKPIYEITKRKEYNSLKSAVKSADKVMIATDEDREGEGIAWHIADLFKLNIKTTDRIVFREITKNAIITAIKNPRKIDMNLVKAQQYRQILDYLVGFELSPVLWKYVQNNLSAGRVQSVVVKLIQERKNKIIDFKHKMYYKTNGSFSKNNENIKSTLNTKFIKKDNVIEFLEYCKMAIFKVKNILKKKCSKKPPIPFITSSIQIECNNRFKISSKIIMSILQKLYENGYITYHRTDSTNISNEIIIKIQELITEKYGSEYLNKNTGTTKKGKVKGAQEAHEAIRPTKINMMELPDNFNDIEKKIYSLIWKRTIASFMSNMLYYRYTMTITIINKSCDKERKELFIANSNETIFDGFTILYNVLKNKEKEEETDNINTINFNNFKTGDELKYVNIVSKQTLTKSKKRYSEATLIKEMEKLGIGRPSTYAQIINTVINRKYVEIKNLKGTNIDVDMITLHNNKIKEKKTKTISGKENKAICITELGTKTNEYLIKQFGNIINYEFTSNIEKELDKIANGSINKTFINDFYNSFHPTVKELMNKKNLKSNKDMNNKGMNNTLEKRKIGKHPSGNNIYGYNAKFGPVIQLGEDDDPNKRYIGVDDYEKITLDESIKLLIYPKKLGKYKDKDLFIKKGKYGYYINWDNSNYKILTEFDEYLTLEEGINCIVKKNKSNMKSFSNGSIKVGKGKYGPYILFNKKFTKIPKSYNMDDITEEQCIEILNKSNITISKK